VKVLVCGGRDYCDYEHVYFALHQLHADKGITAIIEGDAPGADYAAHRWAVANGIALESFLAEWGTYGKAAGPRRNQQMLDEGKPDIVVAFPGGRGTADMVRRAKAAGVRVLEIAP
jgi:hypothetical protein